MDVTFRNDSWHEILLCKYAPVCICSGVSRVGNGTFGTLDKGQLRAEPGKWLQAFAKAQEKKGSFQNQFTGEMGEPVWGEEL